MLKRIALGMGLAGFMLFASASAEETKVIADTKFEIGIGAFYDIEGSDNDYVKSHVGPMVQGTYRFKPNWSLTGIYMYSNYVKSTGYDMATDINRFIGNVNFDFTPDEVYSIYLLAGGGYEGFSQTEPHENSRDGILLDFGGGVRYCFTNTWSFTFAAMAKFNMDHADKAVFLNATLNYRFLTDEQ